MKRFLPDLIAILAFVAISFIYFFPAITEDRVLFQHDSAAGVGAGEEAREYYEKTGERTRWTNSIFGGMPTYQMSPSYDSTESLKYVQGAYHLFLPDYVWLTFVMMLGFYILLRAFGIPVWLSGLGGIIWAFSSYFFILIAAGHIWKFITLAYIPPTIAGIVLAYRKKYLLGGIITALFVALQILSNHVQMSYYFLFVILFIVGAFFEDAWKKKKLPHFFKATGVLFVAALIGISINLSNLYHTYEYSKETMRGKSELKYEGPAASQTSSGLDRDYITQWSYGIGETLSFLVPNINGGASVPLAANETAMKKADPTYGSITSQLFTQYFGDQPGTSGPVYVGAFVLLLFIWGCFIIKGPMKWALLGATIFSILLSWGKNFMPLTDFFIDYVPMYNKFRAVSSILVIAEFTIPLLALFGLKKIIEHPEIIKEQKKTLIVSLVLTAGVALLLAMAPGIFLADYTCDADMARIQYALANKYITEQDVPYLLKSVSEMRQAMVTSDAWRSFFIVAVGTLILLAYQQKKLKATWTIAAIALLCLGDMWSVNKRYLNDEMFVHKSQRTESFRKTPTDEIILQDPSLDYRVLNLATSTFNENNTAYWHKSVGGYHAAKLRHYQEMIDHHISKEMQDAYRGIVYAGGNMDSVDAGKFRVLNMLNTRYFILPTEGGKTAPIQNPYAYGNAWFVNKVEYVDNANEEIDALHSILPTETAVVDKRFKEQLKGATEGYKDSLSTIRMTSYEPNRLTYEVSTPKDGIVVFSEIYYPGWTATIDGKPADIARADYILRAMNVPAGTHTIEMSFDPKSLHVTESIAYGGLALLIIGLMTLVWLYKKKYTGKKENELKR